MSAAIILAAGLGVRMGGPKALLHVDGESLLRQHVSRFRCIGAWPVLVVARTRDEVPVRELLRDLEAELVLGDTSSQAHSLGLAVAAIVASQDAVFVTPVDLRPASPTTLRALEDGLVDEVDAVTPRHGELGGHPVLVRAEVLRALAGDGAEARPLRDVLRELGSRRRAIAVDDAAVTKDFDHPRDLGLHDRQVHT